MADPRTTTNDLALVALLLAGFLVAGCGALFGEAPPPEEPPQPEPGEPETLVVCSEVSASFAGFWTDSRERRAPDLAVRDQRYIGLMLESDGSFWLAEPGWSITSGQWGSCSENTAEIATTEAISGAGGGLFDGEVLGVVCRARDLHPPERRELGLWPCAAPDGSDGPCVDLDGTLLFPIEARPELDIDEIRPLCNRGEDPIP